VKWPQLDVFVSLSVQSSLSLMVFVTTGSQDSKEEAGPDDQKPPAMPEQMGKSKVASWLTSQGLKKVRPTPPPLTPLGGSHGLVFKQKKH